MYRIDIASNHNGILKLFRNSIKPSHIIYSHLIQFNETY